MSFIERETFITVPAELVRSNKLGFGMDAGSTAVKLVYVTKEDKEQADADNSATARVRALAIRREELAEGLEFVKQRAYIFGEEEQADEKSPEIVLTGVGCVQEGKTIAKILKRRYEILSEIDLIATSFCYCATKLPRRLLVEPHDDEQSVKDAVNFSVVCAGAMNFISKNAQNQHWAGYDQPQFLDALMQNAGYAVAAEDETDERPLFEAEPGLYPLQLVAFGSITQSIKVTAPGVFSIREANAFGARSLLGLANKFVGCQSYEELINLASKGDSRRVHELTSDLFQSANCTDEHNSYTAMPLVERTGIETFIFGRLVGANCDNFSKEDLASALLDHCVQDLVQHVQMSCRLQGINRVFLHGGVLSHPNVRRLVVKEMIKCNMYYYVTAQARPIVFDIVRFSHYLAVLGCLVPDQQA